MSLKETLTKFGLDSEKQILNHLDLSGRKRAAARRSLYNWVKTYPNLVAAIAAGVANPSGVRFNEIEARLKKSKTIRSVDDITGFIGREYQLIKRWNKTRHKLLEAIIDGVEHIKSQE